MQKLLSESDIAAINRLLEWQHEARSRGHRVKVAVSTEEDDYFCCEIKLDFWTLESGYPIAYEPTMAAAIDRALVEAKSHTGLTRDTLPAPAPHAEGAELSV